MIVHTDDGQGPPTGQADQQAGRASQPADPQAGQPGQRASQQAGHRTEGQAGLRIRRRDRHGRGLRGTLAAPGTPLNRSRAERFDDLVLQAVAQLEPRWEAELAEVEFAVEEIPPLADLPDNALDGPSDLGPDLDPVPLARLDTGPPPARIVLYRRPLLARADDEDELSDLIMDVVVEEFAGLLGVDPETVDPDYPDS